MSTSHESRPLVTVWITAYNHEKYIRQAIDSVIMQQTDFEYDIVLGEDCSKDKTRDIVLEYKSRYPQKIKLYLPENNLGCNPMFHATYPLCTGKYVAWLDGDDYWLDPQKLQKQVDFLEQNPDIVFCFHKVKMVDRDNRYVAESNTPIMNADDTLEIKHFLIDVNPVNTPSFFHRNILGYPLPEWFNSISLTDLGFYFLLLKHGKGKYFPDMMAAYRVHSGGAWTGASYIRQNEQLASFYEVIEPEIPLQYKKHIDSFACHHYYVLLEFSLLASDYKKTKEYFNRLKNKKFAGLSKRKLWLLKLGMKFLIRKFKKPVSV